MRWQSQARLETVGSAPLEINPKWCLLPTCRWAQVAGRADPRRCQPLCSKGTPASGLATGCLLSTSSDPAKCSGPRSDRSPGMLGAALTREVRRCETSALRPPGRLVGWEQAAPRLSPTGPKPLGNSVTGSSVPRCLTTPEPKRAGASAALRCRQWETAAKSPALPAPGA